MKCTPSIFEGDNVIQLNFSYSYAETLLQRDIVPQPLYEVIFSWLPAWKGSEKETGALDTGYGEVMRSWLMDPGSIESVFLDEEKGDCLSVYRSGWLRAYPISCLSVSKSICFPHSTCIGLADWLVKEITAVLYGRICNKFGPAICKLSSRQLGFQAGLWGWRPGFFT